VTYAKIIVLYDGKQAEEGMARLAGVSQDTSNKISGSGKKAASDMDKAFTDSTSKVGGLLHNLASSGANFGIPFTSSLDKMGSKFDEATGKGGKFLTTLESVGKLSLLAGGALAVGIGAESIHMADQLDVAQAQLETAVKNTGSSWEGYQGPLKGAYDAMVKFGYNNTDVASGLASLTTALGSPTKALSDIGLVANMAAMKNMTFAQASQQLDKIFAGNTRVLAQWGLNLDIGSGKLHSIQSAEFTLAQAHINLEKVQGEVNAGTISGTSADAELASAHLKLTQATLNLQQSQQAIPKILAALQEKTKGASETLGKTFPGQVRIARAELHNLGTDIGEWLIPKLIDLERDTAGVIMWLSKHKAEAEALGLVIGGFLSLAVAVFAGEKLVHMVTSLQSAISWMGKLATSFTTAGSAAAAGSAEAGTSVDGLASDVTGADSTIISANEAAGASFTALLGPIAIAAAATYEIVKAWNAVSASEQYAAQNAQATAAAIAAAANPNAHGDVGGSVGSSAVSRLLWGGKGSTNEGKTSLAGGFIVPNSFMPTYQQILASEQPSGGGGLGLPGSGGIPAINTNPGIGGGGAGGTSNPLVSSGLSLLQSFESAIQAGTVLALRKATTDAMNQKLQLLVGELVATHVGGLVHLADQLEAVHRQALADLNTVLEINQENALSAQNTLLATELKDQTTLLANLATSQATIITDQSKTQADIISERGLYGLNLIAQQMQVALDETTTRWDTTIAGDQEKVDAVTKAGDAAIQAAQNQVDAAATQSQLAQAAAAAALKSAQSKAALSEAQAQATLSQVQNQAKLAEAQEQAQIAIEQAKAAHLYSGSGFVVNITGINPTDANAVASAVGWQARHKIPDR